MIKYVSNDTLLGGIQIKTATNSKVYTNKEVVDFLSNIFMFSDIEKDSLADLITIFMPEVTHFSHGEKIISPDDFDTRIGIIMKGECEVKKLKSNGGAIPLNQLKAGDSFGVLGVFSDVREYPTEIISKKASDILFFEKNQVLKMIEHDSKIAMNIIRFLSNRIAFLNEKISTFSSDNVEQKFSNYVISESRKRNIQHFEINLKRTAEEINSGRASLYRVIDDLSKKSLIKLENKQIFILNFHELERIAK